MCGGNGGGAAGGGGCVGGEYRPWPRASRWPRAPRRPSPHSRRGFAPRSPRARSARRGGPAGWRAAHCRRTTPCPPAAARAAPAPSPACRQRYRRHLEKNATQMPAISWRLTPPAKWICQLTFADLNPEGSGLLQLGQPSRSVLFGAAGQERHGSARRALAQAAAAVALSVLMNHRQSRVDCRQHLSTPSLKPDVTVGSPPVLMK